MGRRIVTIGAALLAVVAIAAVVVIALSLRTVADEEQAQTRCAKTTAYATAVAAVREFSGGTNSAGVGNTDWSVSSDSVPKAVNNYLNKIAQTCVS